MDREVIEYSPRRAEFVIGPFRAVLDGETNACTVIDDATGRVLMREHNVNVRRLGEILEQIEKSLKDKKNERNTTI